MDKISIQCIHDKTRLILDRSQRPFRSFFCRRCKLQMTCWRVHIVFFGNALASRRSILLLASQMRKTSRCQPQDDDFCQKTFALYFSTADGDAHRPRPVVVHIVSGGAHLQCGRSWTEEWHGLCHVG